MQREIIEHQLTRSGFIIERVQPSIALKSGHVCPTIELVSGEVVVTARHPPSGEVVLLAADGQIRARDAHFDVSCLEDVVAVTCLEGSVDVEHSSQSKRISQGLQISYSATRLGTPVTVDPTQVTAWQSGLLVFRDRPLASVVDEVNRYRHGKIVVVSAALRQRAVNGDFEIAKLDSFVTQVQQLTGARATSLPGGLVILS